MKAFKIFIFIYPFILISIAFSQDNIEREKQIRQEIERMIKARDEMLRSLLDDSAFTDFDKKFEDMVRRFNLQNFDQSGFETDGKILGEYDWQETNSERIFILKVKQIKDRPLDIKIEKGRIILKGDVESVSESKNKNSATKVSRIHFERVISIPEDVDKSNPSFDSKNGTLLIKFKKLKKVKQLPSTDNSTTEPVHLERDNNDLSI